MNAKVAAALDVIDLALTVWLGDDPHPAGGAGGLAETKDVPPPTEDWNVIQADYRNRIFDALISYAGGENLIKHKNAMRRAVTDDVPGAFYSGYVEAGGEDTEPEDEKELTRLLNRELTFVDGVFEWVKAERDAETITEPALSARVDTWVAGLSGIYAEGKLRGKNNVMLTFKRRPGEPASKEPCAECSKNDGKRHSAKYWIKRDLVRRNGNENYGCGRWEGCTHSFFTDANELYAE